MRYLLILLLTGCLSNPPIDRQGNNCELYGVSEDQNAPLGCDLGADGMPTFETVTMKQLKGLCGNKGFFDRFAWGCVEWSGTGWRVIAKDNVGTIRHEQCHCLLGAEHSDSFTSGYRLNESVFRSGRAKR